MKSILRTAAICSALFIPLITFAGEKFEKRYRVNVPYGVSTATIDLKPNIVLNPLRILYSRLASCPVIPYTSVAVQYTDSERWIQLTQQDGGYFPHTSKPIDQLRIQFTQNVYSQESCELILSGTMTKSSPRGKETFAGVLEFDGGFTHRMEINLNNTYTAQTLKLNIPSYCQGLEIIKMEIPITDQVAEAEVANFRGQDMIFTTDKPYEFDRILVTLNGPDIKCDVPVYVFAMD